ncbi:MAG: SPOR domain-containing protein [Gemmatimonadetes bacterium]|nr:SPOR domain-containing protein [Gemmatimonadota bacterium]MYH19056.1 SPOR domain-containing protein [Gemmatimonadota bacterium]MYK98064.1 SPOR domain-containing protein [Gemmatimonadota bacterium]
MPSRHAPLPIWVLIMRYESPLKMPFQIALMVWCLLFGMNLAGCTWLLGKRAPAAESPAPQPGVQEPEAPTPEDDVSRSDEASLDDPAEPASDTPVPAAVAEPILGYRVQLYSFTSRESAEAALQQVERTLAEWSYGIYVDEESNSFKVRVGDFLEKTDADILRDWLRTRGFVDAWTAETLIQAR